jgi:hypothetical protein
MAYNSDWLPGTRAGILAMCLKWLVYMTVEIRAAWGALEAKFTARGPSTMRISRHNGPSGAYGGDAGA